MSNKNTSMRIILGIADIVIVFMVCFLSLLPINILLGGFAILEGYLITSERLILYSKMVLAVNSVMSLFMLLLYYTEHENWGVRN